MFTSENELIFIEANEFTKNYDNGTQRTFRFIKFADPLTFENHNVAYSERCDVHNFTRGEKVKVSLQLVSFMNRSNPEVVSVFSAVSK